MKQAIDETSRRRAKQGAYNQERGLDPQPLRKKIADITDVLARESADTAALMQDIAESARVAPRKRSGQEGAAGELQALIEELGAQMHSAASELNFELAARMRDEISDLKKELRAMISATGGR